MSLQWRRWRSRFLYKVGGDLVK